MSRFVAFLVRAYAPLAARHVLVENTPPARSTDRMRPSRRVKNTKVVATLRTATAMPGTTTCRPATLAA